MKNDNDINAKLKYILSHLSAWRQYYIGSVLRFPRRLPPGEYEKIVERTYREIKDKENAASSDNEHLFQ